MTVDWAVRLGEEGAVGLALTWAALEQTLVWIDV